MKWCAQTNVCVYVCVVCVCKTHSPRYCAFVGNKKLRISRNNHASLSIGRDRDRVSFRCDTSSSSSSCYFVWKSLFRGGGGGSISVDDWSVVVSAEVTWSNVYR